MSIEMPENTTSPPVVSVIMCAYNTETYIGAAITSILSQTFQDLELIIIEDASTDSTLSVIQSFSDSRIRLIQNVQNLKPALSANIGLEMAQGKYIARMDSDDLASIERFEKQVGILERYPQIDVLGSAVMILAEGKPQRPCFFR